MTVLNELCSSVAVLQSTLRAASKPIINLSKTKHLYVSLKIVTRVSEKTSTMFQRHGWKNVYSASLHNFSSPIVQMYPITVHFSKNTRPNSDFFWYFFHW